MKKVIRIFICLNILLSLTGSPVMAYQTKTYNTVQQAQLSYDNFWLRATLPTLNPNW